MDIEELKYNFGCSSCGYKDISAEQPAGRIPVARVIEKLDSFFAVNDMDGAGRLLCDWLGEAERLGDKNGELTVINEMLGFYRKINDKERGLKAVERAVALTEELGISNEVSGATVILNAATTMKAFGEAMQAVPLYDKVYDIYSTKLSPTDEKFAGYYNNRALALTDIGQFDDAEICYMKALDILSVSGTVLPDMAVTYVNLAHMYYDRNGALYEKTYECIEKAVEILDCKDIPHDPYFAYVCAKCSPSFDFFGYFTDAQKFSALSEAIYAGT